ADQIGRSGMSARIIDGKALSAGIREDVARRVTQLKALGITPRLAVVLVGDDPASQVYVRHKATACEKAGLHSKVVRLAADTGEEPLLQAVRDLNRDPAIHGILVQLPLPSHIRSDQIIDAIDVDKDVDGFHVANAG